MFSKAYPMEQSPWRLRMLLGRISTTDSPNRERACCTLEEIIREEIVNEYQFAPCHLSRQRAAAVAALGEHYYHLGRIETAAEHRPVYLRKSQAEREREERLNAN